VSEGEVFGFLGPNGSGKSTALRTLVGLITPTSGSATVLGEPIGPNMGSTLARVGYLPGALALYPSMTGRGFLQYLAEVRRTDCTHSMNELAERLSVDLDRMIGELSKGNRQKIGVIQAFMHRPSVLLLDEPTSGLDPLIQREFETMLDDVKSRGGTVMLSSHVLSEVEHLADRIAIINEGRLVVVDQISVLKKRAIRTVDLHFSAPVPVERFRAASGVIDAVAHGSVVSCTVRGSEHDLLAVAVAAGVVNVVSNEPTLDEIFLRYVGEGTIQ
jgi:ABC-2 type transport system ATP-binding protein